MGKSHDNATFLDDGSSGHLIVNSGNQLQVKRSDGLAFGTISKGNTTDALGSGIIYNDVNASGHHFKLGGVLKMDIDASGRVTMPSQPSFRAYNFTPMTGANTIVFTDTSGAGHNIGGHYNTSNGTFTAPVDGVYHFSVSVLMQASSSVDYIRITFKINGSADTRYGDTLTGGSAGWASNYNYDAHTLSHCFYLNANDTIAVHNHNTSYGTYQSSGEYGSFSGFLVG